MLFCVQTLALVFSTWDLKERQRSKVTPRYTGWSQFSRGMLDQETCILQNSLFMNHAFVTFILDIGNALLYGLPKGTDSPLAENSKHRMAFIWIGRMEGGGGSGACGSGAPMYKVYGKIKFLVTLFTNMCVFLSNLGVILCIWYWNKA